MNNPRNISTIGKDNVWSFAIPTYKVTNEGLQDGQGMTLNLCRGNKDDENNPPRQEGVFTETLLEVCRQYLTHVNQGPMATRETSMAITKIDEALMWIKKRADDRQLREVQGTYKP